MGLFSSKLSANVLVNSCYSLANTYHAGIPIVRGLQIASDHAKNSRMKKVLGEMALGIKERGLTLQQAANEQQKYLPEFFSQLLHAGEAGGKLDVMLRDLAEYYEERIKLKRQFMGEMLLPILYLIIAWYLGTFALGIVGMLPSMMSEPSTGGIGGVENYIMNSYVPFQIKAACVVLAVFILCIILSRLGLLSWITCFVTTFFWPFKMVTRKFALARFFRSFGLLLGAGVYVKDSLLGAAATTANPYIKQDLEKALPPIMDGATLAQGFANCKYLLPESREMLFIGEQSGNIDAALLKVAVYHQNEAKHSMQILNRIFFVLVVLFVAAVIGAIVIQFWTNYFGALFDAI